MRIITIVFGLMLVSGVFSLNAWSDGTQNLSDTGLENEQGKMEVSEQVACECCKECMAAKKSTVHEEVGTPATNGCQNCCKRCGKIVKPVPEKIPPEIIEK